MSTSDDYYYILSKNNRKLIYVKLSHSRISRNNIPKNVKIDAIKQKNNASTPPSQNASTPPSQNASTPPSQNASTPPSQNEITPQ
jgi:hypothetical protein